jgi:RNA-binding motif X-linked protein 2
MNVIQEINRINQIELQNGYVNTPASWHSKYAKSAWVYLGNLPIQLSEGDVISVMSQYGEVEDIHLVRDENSGKPKGFCFLKYEDAKSCVLAVDNLNGTKVLGRPMRVDHVENYRLPKHVQEKEDELNNAKEQSMVSSSSSPLSSSGVLKAGHAYRGDMENMQYNIHDGQDLFAPSPGHKQHQNSSDIGGKIARKREREIKRNEKAAKRKQREERRGLKRARKMQKEDRNSKKQKSKNKKNESRRFDSDDDDNDGGDGISKSE